MADLAAIWQHCAVTAIGTPLILEECYTKVLQFYSLQNRSVCRGRWMARNYGWQLSVHTHFNRKYLFGFFSFAEGGLSPKLISPPTPAMYKYRPAFSNNPKVHYHATAEQVSKLGSSCSRLTPGRVELRMNSLQSSSECQSVKGNNNTWHCCVTVLSSLCSLWKHVWFHSFPLLTCLSRCWACAAAAPVSWPDPGMLRSVTSHWLLLAEVPPHIPFRGSWACWVHLWIRPFSQYWVYPLIP